VGKHVDQSKQDDRDGKQKSRSETVADDIHRVTDQGMIALPLAKAMRSKKRGRHLNRLRPTDFLLHRMQTRCSRVATHSKQDEAQTDVQFKNAEKKIQNYARERKALIRNIHVKVQEVD